MRAGQSDAGGGVQLVVITQIDGEPIGLEQLAHTCDSGLERVSQRQLADCLADDRQQSPRALELERHGARLKTRAQCVRGAHAERRQRDQGNVARLAFRREQKLQRPDRRLAQLQSRRQRCKPREVANPFDAVWHRWGPDRDDRTKGKWGLKRVPQPLPKPAPVQVPVQAN